jgi:D-serine deaminase-like pyridoxal phosphate-dependent protein
MANIEHYHTAGEVTMHLYDLDTPALIVDLDRLERNIARMAQIAREGGKQLRPHIKTHKTPEIARMQVEAGADGLTVAKLGEAEEMAKAGFDNIFIANQIIGEGKVRRLLSLLRTCRVMTGVDSIEGAEELSKLAEREGTPVSVRLEVDTGVHRAGVRSIEETIALGQRIAEMPGLIMEGIFTHEGHTYRGTPADRTLNTIQAAEKMRLAANGLRSVGLPVASVSVGSTPGALAMSRQEGITELRPGTYVFYDQVQMMCGTPVDDCALTVLTTVISRPEEGVAIIDAGSKTLSGDHGQERSRYGYVTDDPAIMIDWVNEEHGHLDLKESGLSLKIGQKLRVIPYHVCPCVNLHETLYAVRGERVEAVWKITARGKVH